ncbi:hypothetical protein C8J57DRAFT_760627 [Mycena rebaudengoi]|nr:hypothetical protein C8J57DRAFT_760627 [Mycena rebaudengoi]
MANIAGHGLDFNSKRIVRKHVYDFCATIPHFNGWIDVIVSALEFGDLSGVVQLHDVSWVYAALQDVQLSNGNEEKDWDIATKERVLQLLKALNDATEFPAPSKKVLQVILKALSIEGPCSIQALELLCRVGSWFVNEDFQPILQEHNVWSQMGIAATKTISQSRLDLTGYIQLGGKLSSLTQWTPYIHRNYNASHWITIYSEIGPRSQMELKSSYLSVLELIWGVKYTGTFHFMKDAEKTFAWTLIALSIIWEGSDFSEQQTLQDFYCLIRCTISTVFTSQCVYGFRSDMVLISPNFRATFYAPLGDALIQAAKKIRDMIAGGPTQIENQSVLDRSQQENAQVFHRAIRILDDMSQALKRESEGEQVDRGEDGAEKYWNDLRTNFEEQVDLLEESLKEAPGGIAEISP